MKLLTVVVPCYNSQDYMHYCIESLLAGGECVEILIINDGSKDRTQAIAKDYEQRYPDIVKTICQENKGHGGALNTGIQNAQGDYIKIVDSDDWVDVRAYLKLLETLKKLKQDKQTVDVLLSNFVYEKEGASHKKGMRYIKNFPENKPFTWEETKPLKKGQYLMMHAMTYRTAIVKQSGLLLPEHTFYVDNLFVFAPLQYVKTLYYINVDFYRYFIGREDQSVNEQVMIKRIDQQIKVNKLLVHSFKDHPSLNPILRQYLVSHLEIVTVVSSALLNKAGTTSAQQAKIELWQTIRQLNPKVYKEIKNGALGRLVTLNTKPARLLSNALYQLVRKIYGFN